MSNSPASLVEILETRPQELAIGNELLVSQSRNLTPPLVVDGDVDGSNGFINHRDTQSPLFVAENSPVSSTLVTYEALHPEIVARDGIQLIIPPVQRRWEYRLYNEELSISEVLKEYDDSEEPRFLVRFSDQSEQKVSLSLFL